MAQNFFSMQKSLAKSGRNQKPFATPAISAPEGPGAQKQAFPGFAQAPMANLSWMNGTPPKNYAPPSYGPQSNIAYYNRAMDQWRQDRNQGPNQFQQGMQALLQDVANNNASTGLQFQQGQGLFNQAQGLVAGMDDRFLGTANQLGGMLEQQGNQTAALGGQAVEGWQKLYDQNRSDLTSQLNASNAMGDAAVASFEQARAEHRDMAAQNVSAMLGGMGADIQSQLDQISSGIGPGGEMLTPDQIAQQKQALQSNWQNNRYSVATQLLNQQNETMAKLTQDVGTAQMQAGGLRSQNAGTFAGFSGQSQAQYVDASNQRLAAQDMANNLYAMSANMKNGAQMLSIDRQLAGMQFAAQMAQTFPYSPTSMFDVYMNLMQLQSAGAQKKAGFQFPTGGTPTQMPMMT